MMGRAARRPGSMQVFFAVRDLDAAALSRHRPHQGADAGRQHARRLRGAADLYRLGLRQRLQPVRPHLPGARRRPMAPFRLEPTDILRSAGAQCQRRDRAARLVHHRARHRRARTACRATICIRRPNSTARRRRAISQGQAIADHGEARRRDAAARLRLRVDDAGLPADQGRQHRDVRLRCWRWCSCSWCWRRSTRA